MSHYEYRVVPAPAKGLKAKGLKTAEARFSNTLEDLMNTMGAAGWEYQRAETLPSTERAGLTGSKTEWRNVLVFRRAVAVAPQEATPLAPALETMQPDAQEVLVAEASHDLDPDLHPAGEPGAMQMLADNGVEETSEVAGMTDSLRNLAETRVEKTDA